MITFCLLDCVFRAKCLPLIQMELHRFCGGQYFYNCFKAGYVDKGSGSEYCVVLYGRTNSTNQ